MTREEKKAERDRKEKERAPYRAILKQAILKEIKNVNNQKHPLRVYYQLVLKDGCILNLGYNEKNNEYHIYMEGFANMQVNLKLLQLSKLLYQLGAEFINDEGSPELSFMNRQKLMVELAENNYSCEVADIKNDKVLIYHRSDNMKIFPADGVFFIGPFIPDYLLNGAPEPKNLLEQNDEEFIRGFEAALSKFDCFIYEQRRNFKKQDELTETMANIKGAALW